MRAIICGDAHIGAVFGLGRPNGSGGNTRVDDYESTLTHIVDYTINTKADIFIQTGDMFESRDPSLEHMNIVDKALKRLSNANIATFVIMGNHDYKKSGQTFTSSISSLSASEYPNVRTLLDPEVISVCNASNEKVDLVLIPYRDRRMYDGSDIRTQSSGYNSHIMDLISSADKTGPVVAVGHNFFYEGSYNDYGGTEVMAIPQSFQGCDLAMMGHLHQFRVLRKTAPVCVYTGSMERSNFGDADVDKYFIDYDITAKRAKFCKSPVRDLLDASIDLSGLGFSEVDDALKDALNKYDFSDKIVRLTVSADERILPAVDKEAIKTMLYDCGAFHVSKVGIDVIVERLVRDSSILQNKDDFSIFKAFLDSQGIESKYKKSLLKEAKIIMGDA